jgi:DNA-binding PadR family transcriptional regulator
MDDTELLAMHLQELRRGTVVLACLLALRTPDYGYALLHRLEAAGIASDANTIYPLLRRLEERGLLASEWDTRESRPRKFYRTSEAGSALADRLMLEMDQLMTGLHALAGGTDR